MWHWPFVWSEQVNGLSITPFECYSVERPRAAELTQTEALTCPRGRRPGFRVALHTLFAWFTDPLPKTVTTGRKSNRGPNYLHAGRDDRIQRSFFASTPLRFCAKAVAFLKVSPTPRTEPNRHKRSCRGTGFSRRGLCRERAELFLHVRVLSLSALLCKKSRRIIWTLAATAAEITRTRIHKHDAKRRCGCTLSHARRRRRRRLRVLLRCLLRGCRPLGPGGR